MNLSGKLFIRCLLGWGIAMADMSSATAGNLQPNKLTPETLWSQILAHRLTYIQEGHRGPIIYDFQDPNCPYCHVLYDNEAPLIKEGKLTVRYVPVAFINRYSHAEAAAWLQSPHPVAALKHFEQIVESAFQNGDYTQLPQARLSAKTAKDLHTNLGIMQAFGIWGTPAAIYQMKNGQLGLIPGLVSEKQLVALLPQLK
jgi:thiol:disulfide interchange protein DsbG